MKRTRNGGRSTGLTRGRHDGTRAIEQNGFGRIFGLNGYPIRCSARRLPPMLNLASSCWSKPFGRQSNEVAPSFFSPSLLAPLSSPPCSPTRSTVCLRRIETSFDFSRAANSSHRTAESLSTVSISRVKNKRSAQNIDEAMLLSGSRPEKTGNSGGRESSEGDRASGHMTSRAKIIRCLVAHTQSSKFGNRVFFRITITRISESATEAAETGRSTVTLTNDVVRLPRNSSHDFMSRGSANNYHYSLYCY